MLTRLVRALWKKSPHFRFYVLSFSKYDVTCREHLAVVTRRLFQASNKVCQTTPQTENSGLKGTLCITKWYQRDPYQAYCK